MMLLLAFLYYSENLWGFAHIFRSETQMMAKNQKQEQIGHYTVICATL